MSRFSSSHANAKKYTLEKTHKLAVATTTMTTSTTNDTVDHDFELIHKDEILQDTITTTDALEATTTTTTSISSKNGGDGVDGSGGGIWMGIDLGTSNCTCAVWDSTRGRPKWIRLHGIASPVQTRRKDGRIVPSVVEITANHSSSSNNNNNKKQSSFPLPENNDDLLWKDIVKWNPHLRGTSRTFLSSARNQAFGAVVGYPALLQSLQNKGLVDGTFPTATAGQILTSTKRVIGVCDTTPLKELDPDFRESLPFDLEETEDGTWVVPITIPTMQDGHEEILILYVRPVHVAALLLRAIRIKAQTYLQQTIFKKKMVVPGFDGTGCTLTDSKTVAIRNVVVGAPAYFGQTSRKMVEEAARLAGFAGQISTLTESTAAAMAYGLFVGPSSSNNASIENRKAMLVLDMGGGTTDITIVSDDVDPVKRTHNERNINNEASHLHVVLTDGDNRLGGEDMDQALYQMVLQKACSSSVTTTAATTMTWKELHQELTSQQRQSLVRACQQAKEQLCGDMDHDELPEDSTKVTLPVVSLLPPKTREVYLTQDDLNTAIQPLLERTAQLIERTLHRYTSKLDSTLSVNSSNIIDEVILIGGATRVPALRNMLQQRFFPGKELCVSVNAMSAVAQGTAIQAAILSRQIPLHEVRSAMMLDTIPHAIGVLVNGGTTSSSGSQRFVEILPRDSPLPAKSFCTFYVGDLDQKGITVVAVERIGDPDCEESVGEVLYQPLGEFTFLLHRLSAPQREAILQDQNNPGLRPVDVGMTLDTNGAFQVSVFDSNDPDHLRKKSFYQKVQQQSEAEGMLLLDYVVKVTTSDWKKEGMTAEEFKLVVTAMLLLIFYILTKLMIPKHNIISEEDMARIL